MNKKNTFTAVGEHTQEVGGHTQEMGNTNEIAQYDDYVYRGTVRKVVTIKIKTVTN